MGRTRCSSSVMMDVCKCLLAFTCGYILKSLVDTPPASVCQRCPECPEPASVPLPVVEAPIIPLVEAFKPHTMYEVLRYDYFNSKYLFNNVDDDPKIGLLSHHKANIQDIKTQAEILFNADKKERWKVDNVFGGYKRVDPLRGEEILLDVALSLHAQKVEHHRFSLLKPFAPAVMVQDKQIEDEPGMVHFILPLSKATERFQTFLKNFEEVCLQGKKRHVYLLIVLFLTKENEVAELENVRSKTRPLTSAYLHGHIKIIQTFRPFSRALGIDLGTRQVPQTALLFFCDVDVLFTEAFLERCQRNTVAQRQVYYPMVFAQYFPTIVTKYSPTKSASNLKDINKYTGHWVHYGFGMMCVYNMDYLSVGGFNISIVGWGGEDVALYQKHVKSPIKVFRAADPGLIHVYHNKTCSGDLAPEQAVMCAASMAEGIGSRQQLGKYIVDLTNDKKAGAGGG